MLVLIDICLGYWSQLRAARTSQQDQSDDEDTVHAHSVEYDQHDDSDAVTDSDTDAATDGDTDTAESDDDEIVLRFASNVSAVICVSGLIGVGTIIIGRLMMGPDVEYVLPELTKRAMSWVTTTLGTYV